MDALKLQYGLSFNIEMHFIHTEYRNSSNIERKKERKIEQKQHEAKRNNVEERNTQKEQQTQTRWMY